MENLPELVIRNISKYLSVKDLGACCSTSTSWRVVFNQDHVWRPFCDQLLAVHLKVTECQVEPMFVSPEPEDSSLSPICEWRLSYMREAHLWNNWRHDRYKQEFFGSIRETFWSSPFIQFINSNQVLIKLLNEKRVMLWDVKETPAHLCDPVTLQFDVDIFFCETIEDTIIFVQKDTIQKYKINHSTTAAWELQGIYNLSTPAHNIFITSHFLVVWNLKDILEIFDWKSCETVKIIKIPIELNNSDVYNVEKGGISSIYLIMLLLQSELHWVQDSDNSEEIPVIKRSMIIYVYSIDQLDFIDFNVTISVNGGFPDFTCCINEEFLTVFNDGSIKVYKYLTSELLLDAPYAFSSSIRRQLLPKFQFQYLELYSRDCTDKIDSGDSSVFFINNHQSNCFSPIVRHCLGFKSYDIDRLLRHVTKYLALPKEVAGVGVFHDYPNALINNTYTKCIDIAGPYIVTFW